jgi:hypothetical protein
MAGELQRIGRVKDLFSISQPGVSYPIAPGKMGEGIFALRFPYAVNLV